MRVLVTCGPSVEAIDAVRRVTNFSTGELGTILAETFAGAGHEVVCFRGVGSTYRAPVGSGVEVVPFESVQDLEEKIRQIHPEVELVLHAAALADFVPSVVVADGRVYSAGEGLGKLRSEVKELQVYFRPAPKLLAGMRGVFPRAVICGWKYEVEGGEEEALAMGWEQMARDKTDACVVNGPALGGRMALLLAKEGEVRWFGRKEELAEGILLLWGEGSGRGGLGVGG